MSSVDVIVPCYRYAHFLEACVASVLAQEGVAVRVLVIDDASPDHTPEVCAALVARDPRVQAVRHAQNQGHIRTYNEGIEWAQADHVLLLSADDYLLPGALARAARLLDENPQVGLVFGRCLELAEDGTQREASTPAHQGLQAGARLLSGEEFIRLSGVCNIVPTPTAVLRTALQKRIGGYRPELPHTADLEMWLRAASHGAVGVLADCQAVYRRHGGNMSLGYQKRHFMRDLNQRLAAFEFFFEQRGTRLDMPRLRREMLASLAREAVHAASGAFNEAETALSREFVEFAFRIDPHVGRSLPWLKYRIKCLLGLRGWRVLRSVME